MALFLLAFAIRCLSWPIVFRVGWIFPYGFDAYYHLRRIEYGVAHFPASLGFDPFINFPDGATPHWTPLFDGFLALFLRLCVGSAGREAIQQAVVWVPPVLGALAVVVVYALTRRHLGARSAWIAGLSLALLPAHANYSELGFVDHHVAISLMSALLLAAGMHYVGLRRSAVSARTTGYGVATVLGMLIAGALLLQPGMLLQVGILEVGLGVFFLSMQGREARAVARQLAWGHAIAFVLLIPFVGGVGTRWGPMHPAVLGGFQPWFCGCSSAWFLASGEGGTRGRALRSWVARAAVSGAVGLALLTGSFLLQPALLQGLIEALQLLGRAGSWETIVEAKPLLYVSGAFDPSMALRLLSGAVIALPLILFATLRSLRSSEHAGPRLFLLWWAAGLFAAALAQRRFVNSFAIPMAMLIGWAIPMALRWADGLAARRRVAQCGIAALVSLSCLPIALYYGPGLENQLRVLRGQPLRAAGFDLRKSLLTRMSHWIDQNTAKVTGFDEASGMPGYGVLTGWTYGNLVLYESRRPVVVTNFADEFGGESFQLASEYFSTEPDRAARILKRLRVRYVIAYPRPGAFGSRSMHARLYFLDGSESAGSFVREAGLIRPVLQPVAALQQHRLLYESAPLPTGPRVDGRPVGTFKLYEFVPGARVEGRAHPGVPVNVRLDLTTNRGRKILWHTHVLADERGRYELVLPYSTRGAPPGTRITGDYQVGAGERWERFTIHEDQVLEGTTLRGPDLRF